MGKDFKDNLLLPEEDILDLVKTRNGEVYFNTKKGLYKQRSFNQSELILSGSIEEFVEDHAGNLWLVSIDGEIQKLNLNDRSAKPIKDIFPNMDSLPALKVWSAYLDREEILWLGTGGQGIVGISLVTGKVIQFQSDPKNPQTLSANEVGPIYRDGSTLWAGPFKKGLNRIDLKTGRIQKYSNEIGNPASLTSNIATAIIKDSKGRVWVGTHDGLNLLDEKTGKITTFKEQEGLLTSHTIVNGILEDKDKFIWVVTGRGLSRYLEKDSMFISYDERDGFPSDMSSGLTDDRGNIFFWGKNTITTFEAKDIKDNPIPPPVILTGIQILNKNISSIPSFSSIGNIGEIKKLTLDYTQSFITFEFAALNFNLSEKNQYAYKLEGFDEDWTYAGARRLAYYTSIPPGNYVFKVKAANNDNVWNENGLNIALIITPPFWQTWWFRTILFLVVSGIIFLAYRIRISAIKRQKDMLEKQVQERTAEVVMQKEELEAQAEELLSANEQIKMQSDKVEDLFKEVKDSIRAAQLIQQSILPSENYIGQYLSDFFILNKPKDVVSGDFYWFDVIEDKIVIAAVDCTGHGVSGAFMSITGHFLLNQAIKECEELNAAAILNNLHKGIVRELHHKNENSELQDGMDIALCILDKAGKTVQYAGANNPLYILRNKEVIQVKPNRYSIGLTLGSHVSKFTNNSVDLQSGDLLYIFSDGYADQLGGEQGQEKFMYSRFRNLLIEIHQDDMKQQLQKLDQTLEAWRKEIEQLDDVMVIGIRV